MKELIELDALKEYRNHRIACGNADFDEMERLSAFIATVPRVDAVEVVHGEWVDEHEDGHGEWVGTCSQCHKTARVANFCPNCGAKMKGADDD